MSPQSQKTLGKDVCVIGAGMIGLVTTKNMLEQGLNVTTLEKNDYLGGLWHPSLDPDQTSVLHVTTMNTSRQTSAFTDFPYPDDIPTHPPAKDVENYLRRYADQFDLVPHIRFGTAVTGIERDEANRKWLVNTRNVHTNAVNSQKFDRLVLANGMLNKPNEVKFKGTEKFEGDLLTSRQFKDPSKYKGKRVLVVGIGATGADLVTFLKQSNTKEIYLSHRAQFFLLPLMVKGVAFDHSMSFRMMNVMRCIAALSPRACASLMTNMLLGARKQAFPWLAAHPSFQSPRVIDSLMHRVPVFSDHLADYLKTGEVQTVTGIREISGPRSVTLTDGTVLDDIDAIITCSGYHYDFSILPDEADPTNPAYAPDQFKRLHATKFHHPEHPFARLYQGFISERYPDSLAVLGHVVILGSQFANNDLFTMALASLWSGGAPTPSAAAMAKDIDAHYDYVVTACDLGHLPHPGLRLNSRAMFWWLDDVAGTGLAERLGWFSWKAWRTWWTDAALYRLVTGGTLVPAIYRLYDEGRGRKPWPGARQQIEKTNAEIKRMGAEWKAAQKQEKA